MVNEDSLPNIINTIQKKRTKENYKEILIEYIRGKRDILPLKTKEINTSFFKNINNTTNVNKEDKLKNLILKLNISKTQKNFKNNILKWKNIIKEQKNNNKDININSGFFDSCLSLNKNNKLIDNN